MKVSDVIELFATYHKIEKQQMPISLAYKLNLLINAYQSTYDFYDNEMNKLMETYGARDSNNKLIYLENNSIQIQEDAVMQVQEMIKSLDNLEAPINSSIKFNLNELESLQLTPADLMPFMSFIEIKKPQV